MVHNNEHPQTHKCHKVYKFCALRKYQKAFVSRVTRLSGEIEWKCSEQPTSSSRSFNNLLKSLKYFSMETLKLFHNFLSNKQYWCGVIDTKETSFDWVTICVEQALFMKRFTFVSQLHLATAVHGNWIYLLEILFAYATTIFLILT